MGIPRFTFDIYFIKTFLRALLCKDFQLCISKKNPLLWRVQVCGSPVAQCTYWAPLVVGEPGLLARPPIKTSPKAPRLFSQCPHRLVGPSYSKPSFPMLIIKLHHNSAKALWIFVMKTKWACNAPFDKGLSIPFWWSIKSKGHICNLWQFLYYNHKFVASHFRTNGYSLPTSMNT